MYIIHVYMYFVLDAEGFIHILSSFTAMFSFQAFVSRVQHIYQLKTRSIIVTVGDDEDFTPLIRVFNLDKVSGCG